MDAALFGRRRDGGPPREVLPACRALPTVILVCAIDIHIYIYIFIYPPSGTVGTGYVRSEHVCILAGYSAEVGGGGQHGAALLHATNNGRYNAGRRAPKCLGPPTLLHQRGVDVEKGGRWGREAGYRPRVSITSPYPIRSATAVNTVDR